MKIKWISADSLTNDTNVETGSGISATYYMDNDILRTIATYIKDDTGYSEDKYTYIVNIPDGVVMGTGHNDLAPITFQGDTIADVSTDEDSHTLKIVFKENLSKYAGNEYEYDSFGIVLAGTLSENLNNNNVKETISFTDGIKNPASIVVPFEVLETGAKVNVHKSHTSDSESGDTETWIIAIAPEKKAGCLDTEITKISFVDSLPVGLTYNNDMKIYYDVDGISNFSAKTPLTDVSISSREEEGTTYISGTIGNQNISTKDEKRYYLVYTTTINEAAEKVEYVQTADTASKASIAGLKYSFNNQFKVTDLYYNQKDGTKNTDGTAKVNTIHEDYEAVTMPSDNDTVEIKSPYISKNGSLMAGDSIKWEIVVNESKSALAAMTITVQGMLFIR